jgi:hypothetical protein
MAVSGFVLFSLWMTGLRGGLGPTEVARNTSLTNIRDHVERAIWLDWGHLYPVALAIELSDRAIDASGWWNALNVYGVFNLFGFRATSVGEWITEQSGFLGSDHRWGMAASLPASLLLYGGLPLVISGGFAFGIILHWASRLCSAEGIGLRVLGAIIVVRGITGIFFGELGNAGLISSDVVSLFALSLLGNALSIGR